LMGYAEDESNSVAAETSYQNRLQWLLSEKAIIEYVTRRCQFLCCCG
jgi:hypothetical protein